MYVTDWAYRSLNLLVVVRVDELCREQEAQKSGPLEPTKSLLVKGERVEEKGFNIAPLRLRLIVSTIRRFEGIFRTRR
jgi:hypothetical protein